MARHEVNIDLNLHDSAVAPSLERDAKAADKFGDSLHGVAKDSSVLTKKIAESEAEVKKLVKAFDETGDMDLLKKIRKEQSNLRIFDRLRKSMVDEAEEVGSEAGQKIGESLTKSLMALRGPAIAAAVGIGVIMAPAIGAAINSAVVGGVGIGGIVGGVVAAAQDQSVQSAAKMVASHVGDAFLDNAGQFVKPVIESLNVLDAAGTRVADKFGKIGTGLAPLLPGLTGGATGFVENMMSGIEKAAGRAGPALRVLSTELPKIGDAVGDLFDKISEDPDQAVMGIMAISQALQGVIDTSGDTLVALGNVFEWSSRTGAAMSENMEMLFGWLPIAGTAIKNQGQNFRDQVAAIDKAKDASKDYTSNGIQPIIRAQEEVAVVTKTATDRIKDQAGAMDKMFGRVLDPKELASNYQEAIDNLTESVKKNGKSLDIRTEQGRANEAALRDEAEAILAITKDMFEKTGDVTAANAAFDQMVETLRRQATQLGMNKQQVDAFIESLKAASRQWDVEVRAPGLLEAIDRAQLLNRLMGNISAGARARAGDDSGYGGGRASGGPVYPGQLYTVGENGPELLQMGPSGGYVHNAGQTAAMMSGASGGSVAMRPVVSLTWAPSGNTAWDALVQAIWPYFLKQVKLDGGDLAAFGAT